MLQPEIVKISQTDQAVSLHLKFDPSKVELKNVVDEADLEVTEQFDLMFFLEPYYLKMKFNEPLVDSDQSQSAQVFQLNDSEIAITTPKMNYKQPFTGLDQPEALITGIDEELADVLKYQSQQKLEETKEESKNEEVVQKTSAIYDPLGKGLQVPKEICEMTGCNPQVLTSIKDRLMGKLQQEQEQFSPSRYLFDNLDQGQIEEISQLIALNKPTLPSTLINSQTESQNIQNLTSQMQNLKLNDTDDDLSEQDKAGIILATVYDLVFSLLYEQRFQQFVGFQIEGKDVDLDLSSTLLNVVNLSQTLSWHVYPCREQNLWFKSCPPQTRFKAFVVASFRKALCFGFYKSFDYLNKVHQDALGLSIQSLQIELDQFRTYLLQSSVEKEGEQKTDVTWLIEGHLDPILIYLKQMPTDLYDELWSELAKVEVNKDDLCLNLTEIEQEAIEYNQ